MYLSRIRLDLTHEMTSKTVESPYRTHAAVEGLFPLDARREDSDCRILWRIDDEFVPEHALLYIVSPEPPNVSAAVDRFDVAEDCVATKDYLPFIERICEGDAWRFRLKANPVRRVLVDKGRTARDGIVGSIQGHVTVANQLEWLESRSGVNGFTLVGGVSEVVVSHRSREVFARAGRKVTLVTAQFDGALVVTDAERFRHVLGYGIGRAKGFGCGLLTVASA